MQVIGRLRPSPTTLPIPASGFSTRGLRRRDSPRRIRGVRDNIRVMPCHGRNQTLTPRRSRTARLMNAARSSGV